jgi:hypothetical protein
VVAGLALLVAAVAAVIAVTSSFTGGGGSGGDSSSGAATSVATVTRRSLTAQTQVDGTLGYKGSSTVVLPTGTPPSDLRQAEATVAADQATLRQAEQTVATDHGALSAAQGTLAADTRALEQTQSKLSADRSKVAIVCAGTNAAGSGSGGGGSGGNGSGGNNGGTSTPCETAASTVTSDEEAVSTAQGKVTSDEEGVSTAQGKVTTDTGSVDSARVTLAAAQKSLDAAASSAVFYETSATYTALPSAGAVIRRGGTLFAIGGQPVLLLYGGVPAWRAFRPGMSPGRDVAALNANLRALGYGSEVGDRFTASTAAAITALQAARGLAQTGELPLGSVVFKPGPVRVKTVNPTSGSTVHAGPVLSVSSTRHQVTIALDAALQSQVEVGDPVTITLPSNETTPGRVSSVGKVASPGSGSDSTPTVEVAVRLSHEAAAGQLDQAPVSAAIVTGRVKDALAVPVTALLALAGGGYAVEVVAPTGVHHLVAIELGLFDDADGLVQINGRGLKAGQRVVVPGS